MVPSFMKGALKISHGSQYLFKYSGTAVEPEINFSFTHHDFGPSFLFTPGMPLQPKILKIFNTGESKSGKNLSIDIKSDENDWLDIHFEPLVLKPGRSTDCKFWFKPKREGKFSTVVSFTVNGSSTYKIAIHGYGTEMKIELKKRLKNNIIDFGAIHIGQRVKRKICLVNRSATTAQFRLSSTPSELILQDRGVFNINPGYGDDLILHSGKSIEIELSFSPKLRTPRFRSDINLECMGCSRPLLSVTGACLATCVELDTDSVLVILSPSFIHLTFLKNKYNIFYVIYAIHYVIYAI